MTILTKKNYFVDIDDTGFKISKLAKGKMHSKFWKLNTVSDLAKKLRLIEEMTDEEWIFFAK